MPISAEMQTGRTAEAIKTGPQAPAVGAAPGQPYLHDLVSAVCAPAMSLSGQDGQIRATGAQGLYVGDLRVVSELLLTLGDEEAVPVGHDNDGGPTGCFHGVAKADQPGPDPSLFVRRERALRPTGMVETFTVTSYAAAPVHRRLKVRLSCDLAGTGTVKSGRPGRPEPAQGNAEGLVWAVPGRCTVRVVATPAPTMVDAVRGALAWDAVVAKGQPATISLSVELQEAGAANRAVVTAPAAASSWEVPRVVADDRRLARFVETSTADLAALRMALPARPDDVFLAAGAPWYLTLFGRDSIWAARMLLPLGTGLALGTLRALAGLQGRHVNELTGEQPGKILHELRRGGLHGDGTGPGNDSGHSLPPVYYGTVDATPLWVCLLHDAWLWGAPTEDVGALLGPMQACLRWVRDFGLGREGFVSYVDKLGRGLANQGWKDSHDGVQSRDGRLARAPVSLCEVQGYCYEAARAGAELLDAFGLAGGPEWRRFAAELAERFRSRFWVEDDYGPYPAIALDTEGLPVDSVTSNMGHLLATGILNADEVELVSGRLNSPELNSGFGLRTLATSSAGYNPLSYHCGSVWAHDTAIAISGLARAATATARQAMGSLIEGVIGAAEAFGYRLPELYGGHQRSGANRPLPYPAACRPQAWTAASSVAILTALLGLRPDVPGGRLDVAPLSSPTGITRVEGLVVAGSPVSVQVDGDDGTRVDGPRAEGRPPGWRAPRSAGGRAQGPGEGDAPVDHSPT